MLLEMIMMTFLKETVHSFISLFRNSLYVPLVEIKGFIVLINNKPFFHQPHKNEQEAYEKRV